MDGRGAIFMVHLIMCHWTLVEAWLSAERGIAGVDHRSMNDPTYSGGGPGSILGSFDLDQTCVWGSVRASTHEREAID